MNIKISDIFKNAALFNRCLKKVNNDLLTDNELNVFIILVSLNGRKALKPRIEIIDEIGACTNHEPKRIPIIINDIRNADLVKFDCSLTPAGLSFVTRVKNRYKMRL